MGFRAAAATHGRSSVDHASSRDPLSGTEDLSAFVAMFDEDAGPAPVPPVTTAAPPRSRREARERLRRADTSRDIPTPSGMTIPVAEPEPPVSALSAPPAAERPAAESSAAGQSAPYPSRRALREARAAQEEAVAEQLRPRTHDDAGDEHDGARRRVGAHETGGRGHHRARASRGPAVVAGTAVLALIPGLMFAAPANAATTLSPDQLKSTIASNSQLVAQKLQVSSVVKNGSLQKEDYVADAVAGMAAAESGPDGAQVAVALADALANGGPRATIVETALTYLGDPYELGGASHSGIDCSGLTMVAYASVGVSLVHYVPSQDDIATTISQDDAQPGDLVFFDNDDHVALYLGDGMIIEAPDYGIPVRIVSLSTWDGIGYHFGRILH